MHLGEEECKRRIPFKFKNVWVEDVHFEEIVQDTWVGHIPGCRMFQLCAKLKALKSGLKSLNLHWYSNLLRRVDAARIELTRVQQ